MLKEDPTNRMDVCELIVCAWIKGEKASDEEFFTFFNDTMQYATHFYDLYKQSMGVDRSRGTEIFDDDFENNHKFKPIP